MKLVVKLLLVVMVFMDLLLVSVHAETAGHTAPNELQYDQVQEESYSTDEGKADEEEGGALHGVSSGGRSLWQKKKHTPRLTCKEFPRICRFKGSPGPKCCKKKCVNVLRDRFNCGRCGKKCKFNQICCNRKCVNPSFNRRHCGGCNNSCGNGGVCAFGLCNYA